MADKLSLVEKVNNSNDQILRGENGNIGLVAKVESLEVSTKEIKETLKEIKILLEALQKRESGIYAFWFRNVFIPIGIAGFIWFAFTVMPQIIRSL